MILGDKIIEIIAYPSEKGGYNFKVALGLTLNIIAYPSEKGGYNFKDHMSNPQAL